MITCPQEMTMDYDILITILQTIERIKRLPQNELESRT